MNGLNKRPTVLGCDITINDTDTDTIIVPAAILNFPFSNFSPHLVSHISN